MINEVRLIGNVGNEPDIKYAGQTLICNISVATQESWKDASGQWQNKTSWHRVKAFGFSAKYIEKYIQKGMQVYIEGSLDYSNYEKDGQKIYVTEVKARKIKILGKKGENGTTGNNSDDNGFGGGSSTGDDAPF